MTFTGNRYIQLRGCCISEGYTEGIIQSLESPYSNNEVELRGGTILVLGYPASTFLRFMYQATGVIAERGTNRIESAKFLKETNKPVLFGAGILSDLVSNGDRVQLTVNSDGTAKIMFI